MTMLKTAPESCDIIESVVRPVDCRKRSKVISMKMPSEPQQTMRV